MPINTQKARQYLQAFEFKKLFINELGWNNPHVSLQPVPIDGLVCTFTPIAELGGGMIITECCAADGNIPTSGIRRKIDKYVQKSFHENMIIYVDKDRATSRWTWIKRDTGKGWRERGFDYRKGQPGDSLLQRLAGIAFEIAELDDEGKISIATVTSRVARAFDVERVTKKFYELFEKEHDKFISFLTGLQDAQIRAWYTSVMLNRMMFLYFVQKKGFLNSDRDYLRHKLEESQARGKDRFYRDFLRVLFFQGLACEETERDAKVNKLLGKVPYLNGGIFLPHQIEEANANINIADAAFERLFDFFNGYKWHLDDRPLRQDNEINPDVLGYIFEKYINQKQMGAYYTKEDITDYICKYTILPFLLDKVGLNVAQAMHDVDPYIYEAVSTEEYLPTETEREYTARHQRYEQIRADFAVGKIATVNDLITYNLDIREFVEDYLRGPEMTATPIMLRRFYKALTELTILDPTCGSGAFLFAAMNILEPLYELCLDKMKLVVASKDGFKYPEFNRELERVDQHPNRRYFVLKSIIVNNLYGVDIMDEAVEICKLRLFLKLVSQLEPDQRIEPLPDIDFNIQAGNTLVGFAKKEEIDHQPGTGFRLYDVAEVLHKVESADRALADFRDLQTRMGVAASTFKEAKKDLQEQLSAVRADLDMALMQDYGLNDFATFRRTHKPFHWYMEFNRVMANGGFSVIVGNPPYVEYKNVEDYTIRGYITQSCGDLYSFTVERARVLVRNQGYLGFIIPMSAFSVDGFKALQDLCYTTTSPLFVSHWSGDAHPSKLFEGVDKRLEIVIARASKTIEPDVYTAKYLKWYADERPHLFGAFVRYQHVSDLKKVSFFNASLPKLGSELELKIAGKLRSQPRSVGSYVVPNGKHSIYYTRKVSFFLQFLTFIPEIRDSKGKLREPSELKSLLFRDEQLRNLCLACLSSSLFYWFYTCNSDCRNLNKREIISFPIPDSVTEKTHRKLALLLDELMNAYRKNSTYRTVSYASVGTVTVQYFNFRPSKPIIDEIDQVLARHYGFTDEEADFIINYDIKYRMGKDNNEGDGDAE